VPRTDKFAVELDEYTLKVEIVPAFTVRPRNLVFTVAGPAGTIHAIGRMFRMQLQDNQQVRLTVAGQDALGNDIPTDKLGDLTAVSSDDRLVTVAAESPGVFLVKAVAGADSTSASVLVSDDVNADGTADLQGSVSFDLVDHRRSIPASITVRAGTPELQPDAPA
jgi:hypothetical protein